MKKTICLIVSLTVISINSYALEGVVIQGIGSGALGLGHDLTGTSGGIIALGARHFLNDKLFIESKVGRFADPDTFFGGVSFGVMVEGSGGFALATFGPYLIDETGKNSDDQKLLDGPLQFESRIIFGKKTYSLSNGLSIGIGYLHYSNAEIKGDDIGRNYIIGEINF